MAPQAEIIEIIGPALPPPPPPPRHPPPPQMRDKYTQKQDQAQGQGSAEPTPTPLWSDWDTDSSSPTKQWSKSWRGPTSISTETQYVTPTWYSDQVPSNTAPSGPVGYVDPQTSPPPFAGNHGKKTTAVVASTVMAIFLIIILAFLSCFFFRKSRKRKQQRDVAVALANDRMQMTKAPDAPPMIPPVDTRAYIRPPSGEPPADAVATPRGGMPPSAQRQSDPPIILSTTMDQSYFTGIDTSDRISLADARSNQSVDFGYAHSISEPPPPYRPYSIRGGALSRDNSCRASLPPYGPRLSVRSQAEPIMSPFDDPEEESEADVSDMEEAAGPSTTVIRDMEEMSDVSELSYQDDEPDEPEPITEPMTQQFTHRANLALDGRCLSRTETT